MRSISYVGGGGVALSDVADPVAAAGQAIVRVEVSALCGSERSALRTGMPGNAGHEAVGTVIHIAGGGAIDGGAIGVGDRVGISALIGCGSCPSCLSGDEVACAAGVSTQLGMHAELVASPVQALRRLPTDMDPILGVLLAGDTLGVAYRALRRAPLPAGGSVIVIGLGAIGLGHVLARSRAGADVTGIDPVQGRRHLAQQLGAGNVAGTVAEVSTPADLVIEATGLPTCIETAFRLVRHGGTVLQSGECAQVQLNPSRDVVHRETAYVGSWYFGSRDLAAAIAAEDDDPRATAIATSVFGAADARAAFAAFATGTGGKIMLRWNDTP